MREKEGESRVLKGKIRAMKEVRREEEEAERAGRGGRLRELGAERKARRLERENKKLKERLEGLEAKMAGEDDILGSEKVDVAIEKGIEDEDGGEMEGEVEVGFS